MQPKPQLNLPLKIAYINTISQWWPPEAIATALGVPGYAKPSPYNMFIFTFWLSSQPFDIVKLWSDPVTFFGDSSPFGKTKEEIQKNLKRLYNDAGIKILISAFGATDNPTSEGRDPIQLANRLGQFVKDNNVDGVDIDWEDNGAMEAGKGQEWLIKFQLRLRELLPNHIISHAPQAPYFKRQHYKNGAYCTILKQVGHTIDFYNVQFYNQGNTQYNSFDQLFINSCGYFSGTAVKQIIQKGVPANKLVVTKPVAKRDVCNSGWVDCQDLGKWISQAANSLGWRTGLAVWQYSSDVDCEFVKQAWGN